MVYMLILVYYGYVLKKLKTGVELACLYMPEILKIAAI